MFIVVVSCHCASIVYVVIDLKVIAYPRLRSYHDLNCTHTVC